MFNFRSKTQKIFFFLIGLFLLIFPAFVSASLISGPPPGGLPDKAIGDIILQVTNWLLGFVTAVAVLALIWGGVRYLTAAGDDSAVEEAKKIITQAVIGLVIVGISYSVVKVVVETWIGTT